MLIFLSVSAFILFYGLYRCIMDKNLSYFRWLKGLIVYTFFKGDKVVSVIFWVTIISSQVIANIFGPMKFNFSKFNLLSHLLFGFLARELIETANDYYPFINKVANRFPESIAKHVNPTTFAFILCMGNGIQEEIQKMIPGLKSLVWTNLKDQIIDAFMDTTGITLSIVRESLLSRPRPNDNREDYGVESFSNETECK